MHPGDRIAGRFELIEEAAKGGMGTVYRALDRLTKQPVALKVLQDIAEVSTTRFAREVAVLSQLSHPGIVRYIAHGKTSDDIHYMVTEWVDGETLLARLDREGLSARETVLVGRKVAEALGEAHRRGVVHRDVKPSNLMFQDKLVEHVKVLDFGIARRAHEELKLTQTGMMVGTMGYMSPEQARGTRNDMDARADVFSLGCVLYECLTGKRPFTGENMMAVRAKILISDPPRARQLVGDLPPALDDLIGRMLAKDPQARPADAVAVAAELAVVADLADVRRPRSPSVEEDAITREAGYAALLASDRDSGDITQERIVCVVLLSMTEDQYSDESTVEVADIERTIESFGGKLHSLADGSMVAVVSGGSPVDLAQRAARCALLLRERFPTGALIVQSARAQPGVLEQVIDRGVRTLGQARLERSLGEAPAGFIWLDELTAGLLPSGFDVHLDAERYQLRGVR